MHKIDLTGNWQDYDYSKIPGDACVVRYGAFGDMIQSASVFAALKDQGLSVTVNTAERGYPIIRNDPNVDTVFYQKDNQVPNDDLPEYWDKLKKRFSRFINLSESVERSLLAVQGDKPFEWHPKFRRMVMGNVDYLSALHAISDCEDYPKRPFFYPNNAEIKEAKKFRAKLGMRNKVVMWVLTGSSVHKAWPYMDMIIARIMLVYPQTKIVMVGDDVSKLLELGWQNESRVIKASGDWSIRRTLAFIDHCDVVIGPETGVMNAASFKDVYKILLLSHSSKSNIGGSWHKTFCMVPEHTPCYPCHKLHYSWSTCVRDTLNTGGAMCQANISPEAVWEAFRKIL